MSVGYRILYRLGITPWERDDVPDPVKRRAAAGRGRALDLGCGTGRDAVHLAQQGWTVTAVDAVPMALGEARERARRAGVEVDFRQGDVTRLSQLGVESGYDLVLDRGCFHGLGDEERERCAAGVNELVTGSAELLIFAFSPGWHGPAPRGISAEEILERFGPGEWELVESTDETPRGLPPWLRGVRMSWHSLRRAAQQRASASA
jgi:SAM-dependent methyltransferase